MTADRSETFERELALEPGRTALLVVDMQRGFLDPGEAMEVPPARETVPVIRRLLDLFRARRLPVVFTEFTYSEAAPLLVGRLHPEHRPAAPGAPTQGEASAQAGAPAPAAPAKAAPVKK